MTTAEQSPGEQRSYRQRIKGPFVSGLAIAVPVLITLVVFRVAMSFILDSVRPLAGAIRAIPGVSIPPGLAAELAAMSVLVVFIFLVGVVAESQWGSGRLERGLDTVMSTIPGLGSVYSSFDEMSEMLLDSGTESFQEVVLVEYPVEDSYCVAFVTAETPPNICEATANVGPGMTTVYLPMAPNPVMGGFVVHISNEKVYEVDMTVEEGVQSVVTSGIAVGETDDVEGMATVSGNANLTGDRRDSP